VSANAAGGPVAILAGGGVLPGLIADALVAQGRKPVVFAIDGEADPATILAGEVHPVRWGELGRVIKTMESTECTEAVFIGGISRRPDLKAIRPDLGALRILPRILSLMRGGDDSLLVGLATIFEEHGVPLVSPLAVAPALALPEGVLAGKVSDDGRETARRAVAAARAIGRLDIGQAAVAVGRRVVAVEDAGGTDDLLRRIASLRERGRIPPSGGVLVKCMKPHQDPRLDVPGLGPHTAESARRAGLDGVAAEAGRTIVAGMPETLAAFHAAGIFLLGLPPPEMSEGG
jgi:DUF1009 family protein